MKYFIYLFMVISLIVGGCSKKSKEDKNSGKTDDVTIKIETHGKPTMVIFDVAHCTYCKKLRYDIKTNKQIQERLNKLSVYYIDADEDKNYLLMRKGDYIPLSTKEIARALGFRGGTPYIVFLDKNSNIVVKLPGYLRPNYFIKTLDYVLTKSYKKIGLNEYLQKK